MAKKPFILLVEGPDAVGKDYFIKKVSDILSNNNLTYQPISIKPFVSDELKDKLNNKKLEDITIKEANKILLAHFDYIKTVYNLVNSRNLDVIILNRTFFSYYIYQLLINKKLMLSIYNDVLVLPKLNNEHKEIKVPNIDINAYNKLNMQLFKEIKNMYIDLLKDLDYLFVNLIHRAYGDKDYYKFAIDATIKTLTNRGLNNFNTETIANIVNMYSILFEPFLLESFDNLKLATLTSDYYQHTADIILESFKER